MAATPERSAATPEPDEPVLPLKRAAWIGLALGLGTLPCLLTAAFLAVAASGSHFVTEGQHEFLWDAATFVKLMKFVTVAFGIPLAVSLAFALRIGRRRMRTFTARRRQARAEERETRFHATSAAQCPYCKTTVATAEASVRCPACATSHHAECWREHGGCTTFACVRGPKERPERPLAVQAPGDVAAASEAPTPLERSDDAAQGEVKVKAREAERS